MKTHAPSPTVIFIDELIALKPLSENALKALQADNRHEREQNQDKKRLELLLAQLNNLIAELLDLMMQKPKTKAEEATIRQRVEEIERQILELLDKIAPLLESEDTKDIEKIKLKEFLSGKLGIRIAHRRQKEREAA